jgi:DNA-binding MarR family transcriptional regulator
MPINSASDAVDLFIREWSTERSDLDLSYLATLGRIIRIAAHLREKMDSWLEPFGVSWEVFDLLVSLRRSGPDAGLRPTDLYEACMLSSGAITNRINRAETGGYVVRRPDRKDGRAVRIALTARGRALADQALTEHSAHMREISDSLIKSEQRELGRLLRTLLGALEDSNRTRAPLAATLAHRNGARPSRTRTRGTAGG